MITAQELSQSVHPFTGTTTFPVSLVDLPGRNGMDLALRLLYHGNVRAQAQTWNLEAPTGIAGLGWSLDQELIIAELHQNAAPSDISYYYVSPGAASRLVQTGTSGSLRVYRAERLLPWAITYDPAGELWTVIKDDGTTFRFGGRVTGGGAQDSVGNSIQWGVRWGAWVGSSAQTAGQSACALVWNLASATSTTGDTITYQYSLFADDQVAVGSNGLRYTRASYLAGITDSAGRVVRFEYGDKKYDVSGQREYQPAHTGAKNTPNAYQDRYETRYLSALQVSDAQGAPLLRAVLGYDVVGDGLLAKRYLRSLTKLTPSGESLPPLTFTYRLTDPSGAALGLLQTVTLPEGGVCEYTVELRNASAANRTLSILQQNRTQPRVSFYLDYAVVTWFDSGNKFADVYAYTWDGQWVASSQGNIPVADQYANLQVVTEDGFFAIFRPTYTVQSAVKPQLHLYRRSGATPGQFDSTSFWLDSLTDSESVEIASGQRFVAVLGKSSGKLLRFRWTGAAWQKDEIQLPYQGQDPKYSIAGQNNYLAVLSRPYSSPQEKAEVRLYYVDPLGAWQTGMNGQVTTTAQNADDVNLYAGNSFVVLRVENDRTGPNDYRYQALWWTPDFSTVSVASLWTSGIGEGPVPAVRGSLVGIDTQIFRFDGQSWSNRLDLSASAYKYPNQTGGRNFAYGFDKVVRRVERSISGDLVGYAFDITEFYPALGQYAVDAFNGAALPSVQTDLGFMPVASHTIRFPSNYVILSSDVYYEMPDFTWVKIGKIPDDVAKKSAASVQISGSRFLSYQQGADARVVLLRNGALGTSFTLTGRSIYASGYVLSGPAALVSYTGSFDSPSSLQLHAVGADGVDGAVANWAVTRLELADGFGRTPTSYVYEAATATADAGGTVNCYNKVTVVAGSSDATRPYGATEKYFFNGLPNGKVSRDFPTDPTYTNAPSQYGRLKGLSYCELGYGAGGQLVSSTTSSWMVYLQTLVQAVQGFSPRLTRQDGQIDGVATTTLHTYTADSLLPAEERMVSFNWQGTQEDVVTSTLYASQVYPEMKARQMLSQVAQVTRAVGAFNTRIDATTWKAWDGGYYAPVSTYRSLAHTSGFDFAAWGGGAEPPASLWLKTSQVTRRSSRGLVLESLDASGVTSSTVYDASQLLTVATFTNASVAGQQAAYLGFESYEPTAGWTLGGGAAATTDDAHSGERSLRVPAPAGGALTAVLQRTFSTPPQQRAFFAAFWVKTDSGFNTAPGTAYLQLSANGVPPQQVAIEDTGGAWKYLVSQPFTLPAGGGVTVTLYTAKQTAGFLFDDVIFAPVDSLFAGMVYEGPEQLLTARLGINRMALRYVYDGLRRQVATIGPAENVDQLELRFYARQTGAAGPSPSLPNTVTSIKARQAGTYLPFRAGWQSQWQTTDTPNWSVQGGTLRHAGNAAATAQWLGYAGQQSYGVRVEVQPLTGAAPAGRVALRLGTLEVAWAPAASPPGSGTWSFNGAALPGVRRFARDWALALVDGRALFWAGGQLLVDTMPAGAIPGTATLVAETSVGFRGFVTFVEPLIQVACTDGVTNIRQELEMAGAQSVVVAQSLYDGLARPAIRSKASTYAVKISEPLFAYRADYITNAAEVWQTGTMTGRINDFHSADAGYPYSRTVFEAAPLGRAVEVGLPGKSFASGARTNRSAFLANSGDGLPAGRYFVTRQTNPDGIVTLSTVDQAGNLVRKSVSSGGTTAGTTSYSYVWSATARTVTISPPAAAAPPGTITAADYQVVWQYDYLDQAVKVSSKAQGDTLSIYGPAGELRFRLTADGADATNPSQDVVQYWRYDVLGRLVEAGTTRYGWSLLPPLPAPSYMPPSTLTPRVRQTYLGLETLQGGRLGEVRMLPAAGGTTPDAVKTFAYDAVGNVAGVSLQAAAYAPDASRVRYEYDNFHNPTTVRYLEDALVVRYDYDRRGLLSLVQTPGSPAYASYLYDADGAIAKESLGIHGSSGLDRTYTYNPPGWLSTLSYRYFAQTLLYDQPGAGYQGATYYSGLAQAEMDRELFDGAPPGYSNQYKYDTLGQLQYSLNDLKTDWGIGIGSGVQYDPNGNLLALNRGNTNLVYKYQTANQVASVSGGVSVTLSYTPGGSVRSALPAVTEILYDPFSGRASRLSVGTGAKPVLSFQYDEAGRRISKQTQTGGTTASLLYVHGMNDLPLVEREKGTGGQETITFYVYTPNGLVAFVRGGATRYVIRDVVGSPRVIFDSQGNVVASYDYLPFGKLVRTTGDPALLRYRYTGQEFDAFGADLNDGLYNYRARLYDWNLGRFYQPDPLWQFASPYVYVGNNPVSFNDPTGESWWEVLGVVAALLGAAAAGILVGLFAPVTLPMALGLFGAWVLARIGAASYALATGADAGEAMVYANSYGSAAFAFASGVVFGPMVGMSWLSVATAEAFGVMNGFSLQPAQTPPSQQGYYLAAGIVISFATEALGNTAVKRYAGVGYAGVEAAVEASTLTGALQKTVAGFSSGFLVAGGAALASGDSADQIAFRAFRQGIAYGAGSLVGATFRGPDAIVQSRFAVQFTLEKGVKQWVVMTVDPSILWSRINMVKTWAPWVLAKIQGSGS